MKHIDYILSGVLAVLVIGLLCVAFATKANAQVVPAQNQIIPSSYFGAGYLISTSTSPTHKLGASLVDLAGSFITGILPVSKGGTGSTTLSGILKGNGTSAIQTAVGNTDYQLPISLTTTGSSGAATFDGTTLNIPQYSGGGGSGTVATSSAETATYVPFWTSTAGTPALLSGGSSAFTWDNVLSKLTVTNASTTDLSSTNATTTNLGVTRIQAIGSGGISIYSNSGSQIANHGAGGGNNASFLGGVNVTGNLAVDTDVLYVDTTNNRVGVSTTTPQRNFVVAGSILELANTANANIIINNGGTNRLGSMTYQTAGVDRWYTGTPDSDVRGDGTEYFIGTSNSDAKFWMESTGEVGIGTSSPFAKLSVAGDAYIGGNLTATGTVTFTNPLTVANGGTGNSSFTAGNLLYADTANTISGLTNVATGRVLISQGASAAPIWSETATLNTAVISPVLTTNNNTSLANLRTVSSTGIGAQLNAASLQLSGSTNVQFRTIFNGSAATTLTANTSYSGTIWGAQVATEATSGTHPLLANVAIKSPIITNGTAATTDLTSLYIEGAPTGITPTNTATALWVDSGIVRIDDTLGIATSSPFLPLSVGGSAYIGGNLTATGTLAVQGTATSTFAGGIQAVTGFFSGLLQLASDFIVQGLATFNGGVRIPSLGTPAGAFLAVDADGDVIATSTPSGGGSSASTLTPYPNYPTTGALSAVNWNASTTAHVTQFVVPVAITADSISFYVDGTPSAGTVDIGIYSEDGQTQLLNHTTASLSGSGLKTETLASPLSLSPGVYYLAVVPNGSASINIYGWQSTNIVGPLISDPTGAPRLYGILTVTAATLPASFTPSNISENSQGLLPFFRLDN